MQPRPTCSGPVARPAVPGQLRGPVLGPPALPPAQAVPEAAWWSPPWCHETRSSLQSRRKSARAVGPNGKEVVEEEGR